VKRNLTYREKQRRKAVVDAWIKVHGYVCPGWGRVAPHPSFDLTADHVFPLGYGGREDGALAVRCRGCNARRRHTPQWPTR
jgi:hypothetical protein